MSFAPYAGDKVAESQAAIILTGLLRWTEEVRVDPSDVLSDIMDHAEVGDGWTSQIVEDIASGDAVLGGDAKRMADCGFFGDDGVVFTIGGTRFTATIKEYHGFS